MTGTVHAEIEADGHVPLVSPERLNNPGFRDHILPKLAYEAGMLVIDEAHCILTSHDFRPDYRRLRTVIAGLAPGVPVLATTATANARVTRDVAEQLGSGWRGPGEPPQTLVLRGPLDRVSLHLAVVRLPAAPQRLAWLADRLGELPGSGIVYTLTVAAAHDVAEFLRDRGYAAEAYTAIELRSGWLSRTTPVTGSRRSSRPARLAWFRQARPGVHHPSGALPVAGRLLPADRPAGRGGARRGDPAVYHRGPHIWAYRQPRLPAGMRRARGPAALADATVPSRSRHLIPRGPVPHPAGSCWKVRMWTARSAGCPAADTPASSGA